MSVKSELAERLREIELDMRELEAKRSRSQGALLEALISHQEPDATEIKFFRQYSAEIDAKREELIALTRQIEELL